MRPVVFLVLVAGLVMATETRELIASGMKVGDVAARVGGDVGQRLGVAVRLTQKLVSQVSSTVQKVLSLIGTVELLPVVWIGRAIGAVLGYSAIALPPPAV